ncbi:MAG: hypothetical protein FWF85_01310 [Clostridiales bacterium]|nr:hypothetical protein [Clostridiales bacterium]
MNVLEYKCPNCGAPLVFSSGVQKMKCGSCGAEMEVENLKEYDEALKQAEISQDICFGAFDPDSDWQEGERLNAYICQSCGGELLTDAVTLATECPYCGNVTVVPEKAAGVLRPDFVIPFKLDKEAAKANLIKFYKGKPFLPKLFKEDNRIDKITGIYVPFWLFDCDTSSQAVYKATRVHSWSRGNMRYTKTDHFLLTRAADLSFVKVPADGSEKMDDTMMEAIEPYNYNDLTGFSLAYLSGYLADKYDVSAETNRPRVEKRMKSSVEKALRATVSSYATVQRQSLNMQIRNGDIHYAMLPVWLLNTKWGKKNYTFMMNGQSGKMVGDLPIDWQKAAKTCLGIFAGLGAVFCGISFFAIPGRDFLQAMQVLSIIGIIAGGLSFLSFLPIFRKKKGEKKT